MSAAGGGVVYAAALNAVFAASYAAVSAMESPGCAAVFAAS